MIGFVFFGGVVSRYHLCKSKTVNRLAHLNGCITDSMFPLGRIYRAGEPRGNRDAAKESDLVFGMESG